MTVAGGNLGLAVIEAPRPTSGIDSRYWLAVIANSLSGTLTLGGSVSASVTRADRRDQRGRGTNGTNAARPVNWKAAVSTDGGGKLGAIIDPGADITPAGSVTLPITLTGGELLLSGSLTSLNIFNVITGSANFASARRPSARRSGARP